MTRQQPQREQRAEREHVDDRLGLEAEGVGEGQREIAGETEKDVRIDRQRSGEAGGGHRRRQHDRHRDRQGAGRQRPVALARVRAVRRQVEQVVHEVGTAGRDREQRDRRQRRQQDRRVLVGPGQQERQQDQPVLGPLMRAERAQQRWKDARRGTELGLDRRPRRHRVAPGQGGVDGNSAGGAVPHRHVGRGVAGVHEAARVPVDQDPGLGRALQVGRPVAAEHLVEHPDPGRDPIDDPAIGRRHQLDPPAGQLFGPEVVDQIVGQRQGVDLHAVGGGVEHPGLEVGPSRQQPERQRDHDPGPPPQRRQQRSRTADRS